MTYNFTIKAKPVLNEQALAQKNSLEDPNMVKLKQDIEKDALLNSPKRVVIQAPGDKPCELISSILRSSSKTSQLEAGGGFKLRLHQLQETQTESQKYAGSPGKRGSIIRGNTNQDAFESIKTSIQSSVIRYTYDNVLLNPPIGKQADAILKHLDLNNSTNSEGDTALKAWKEELKHKDIKDGKVIARECSAPLTKPFYLKKLEKVIMDYSEIDAVYGEGPSRRLRPGEEATIISVIEDLIASFLEVDTIPHLSFSNSREQVLTVAGLTKLNEYPICVKQVDLHMRIMFTKFRCSLQYREHERKLRKFMQMAENRNWLIDLNTGSELSNYLLKNCKIDPHATKILKTEGSMNRSPSYNI